MGGVIAHVSCSASIDKISAWQLWQQLPALQASSMDSIELAPWRMQVLISDSVTPVQRQTIIFSLFQWERFFGPRSIDKGEK